MKKIFFLMLTFSIIFIACSQKSSKSNTQQAENTDKIATSNPNQDKDVVAENASLTNAENTEKNSPVASDKVIYLNSEEFMAKVMDYKNSKTWNYKGELPCIIDFYADWCKPCKMIAPTLDELAKDYKGKIYIYKVNTDKEKDLARAFQIQSIPALLFCPMQGEPQMAMGAREKADYKKIIDSFLLKK